MKDFDISNATGLTAECLGAKAGSNLEILSAPKTEQPAIPTSDILAADDDDEPKEKPGTFVLPDPLPADLKAAQTLWTKVNHMPENTPAQILEKRRVAAIAGPHFFRLQQASPVLPPCNVNGVSPHDGPHWRRSKGAQHRAHRINVLTAALAKPPKLPIKIDPATAKAQAIAGWSLPPRERLRRLPGTQALLNDCKRALMEWELFSLLHYEDAHPTETIEQLNHEIANCSNVEDLPRLKRELAAAHASNSPTPRLAAQGRINMKLDPVMTEFRNLLAGCRCVVEFWCKEAVEHEKAFLSAYGLNHEPTALSRRYTAFLAELKAVIPNPNMLHFFNVNDCTE
jgi:hypothetical protein